MIIGLVAAAVYTRRLYVQTVIFMDNILHTIYGQFMVKRAREVSVSPPFLSKKVEAIRVEEKEELIQPMFSELYSGKTKL